MNAKTAKLIRRSSALPNYQYRQLKRAYKRVPRQFRNALRQSMKADAQ
jgi:predicted component of type VI protein secretion system